MIIRLGECRNCGDCCLLFVNGKYERCRHYDSNQEKHCINYANRPGWCRMFPRSPMDILNKPNCGFWFVDEKGFKIDAFEDKRVKLKLLK